MMQLETSSLIIRGPILEDVPFIIALREDPVLRRFTSWPRPGVDLHEWAKDHVQYAIDFGPGKKPYPYIMIDKKSGERAGNLTVFYNDPGPMQAEIGYSLAHGFHRRGFMVEGLAALIPYILREFKLHRLVARVNPENMPSVRILEKLGFRLEGTQIAAELKDEKWHDICLYALLNDEWRWPR